MLFPWLLKRNVGEPGGLRCNHSHRPGPNRNRNPISDRILWLRLCRPGWVVVLRTAPIRPRWGVLPWFRFCLLCLCLCSWASAPAAQSGAASAAFDEANKLYEGSHYAQAISAYQKLLQQNEISAAVYFNLGNAYFKNGQTGHAIYYYRLAQRLAPRDPDIRANLWFARDTVGAKGPGASVWHRWLNLCTLNELTVSAAVVFWLWFLVLTASQIRRDWIPHLRLYRNALGIATVLVLAWLGVVLQNRFGSSSAVVITREAAVRYGPFEEAQAFFKARDGTELTVLGEKGGWYQVADGSKRAGWLQAKEIALLPRG
jgi:tetratricopeptide (TPR) repeat protein